MQATGVGIDVGIQGIGGEDMAGEGIELRRVIAKKEGEGDGWEGMRVRVIGSSS